MIETVYVASLAIRDGSNNPVTVWVGTRGWATAPTDTPANTLIEERLTQPGNFGRNMFSGGLFGTVGVDFGEAVLANGDGYLDYLSGYAVDGGTYTLRVGTVEQSPSAMTTVFVAAIESLEYSLSEIVIRLRDRLWELDAEICTSAYAGTGYQEGGDDIEGKKKPVLCGYARVIAPTLVDEANVVFQIGEPPDSSLQVYCVYCTDNGVELDIDMFTVFASSIDDLWTTDPGAGYFRVYKPLGLIRFGSPLMGEVRAVANLIDASTGSTTCNRVGTLIGIIAERAGLASADIDADDLTDLDTAGSNQIFGTVAREDTTALDVIGKLARAVGAWVGFDRLGVLRTRQLAVPSGTAVETLLIHDCLSIDRIVSGDPGRGVPVWQLTAAYDDANDPIGYCAGAVGRLMRDYHMLPAKEYVAQDASILTRHPYAAEYSVDLTANRVASYAKAEADRQLALLSADREIVRVAVEATPTRLGALDLDALVTLKVPRYDWTSGKLFRVVGITTDLAANRLTLDLWG